MKNTTLAVHLSGSPPPKPGSGLEAGNGLMKPIVTGEDPGVYAHQGAATKGISLKAVLMSIGIMAIVGGSAYVGYSVYAANSNSCKPDLKLDLIFVVDESGSVGEAAYSTLTESISNFVDSLDFSEDSVRVGLVEFSGIQYKEGILMGEPYPNTNLKDVAIQSTINLHAYNEDTKEELKEAIRNLNYSAPASKGTVSKETIYRGLNERLYTCVSCAFQYLRDDYFPTPGNSLPNRNRFIIFIGDGVPTRGTPLSPEVPLRDLREAYPFRLLFIPVSGSTSGSFGFDKRIFGSAFDPETDVHYPVESYDDLAKYVEELKTQEIVAKCTRKEKEP